MIYFNDLSDRIEKAQKHELNSLELEAQKAYAGFKRQGEPRLDQIHYAMIVEQIEARRK